MGKIKKRMNALVKKAVYSLPRPIRFKIYRKKFKLNKLSGNIEFKRVETQQEYEAASQLLYNSYLETNFINEDISSKRITRYNLLPSTNVLIVKENDKIVGTVTLIVDEAFGLPTEKLGHRALNKHIVKLRSKGDRIVEVSGLAIAPSHRKRLLPHIFCYLYQFSRQVLGADHLLMNIEPRSKMSVDIYEGILGFKVWNREGIEYKFVNNTKMVGMTLDLFDAEDFFERHYRHKGQEEVYNYFLTFNYNKCFRFPKPGQIETCNQVFDESIWSKTFWECKNTFCDLSRLQQARVLKAYYGAQHNLKVKETIQANDDIAELLNVKARWIANIQAEISELSGSSLGSIQIMDMAERGFKVRKTGLYELAPGQTIKLRFLIYGKQIELNCMVVWSNQFVAGLKIVCDSPNWTGFTDIWKKQNFQNGGEHVAAT